MASSVFGAVASAKEFFESDFWKGPKPTPETLYRVHLFHHSKRLTYLGFMRYPFPILIGSRGRQSSLHPGQAFLNLSVSSSLPLIQS